MQRWLELHIDNLARQELRLLKALWSNLLGRYLPGGQRQACRQLPKQTRTLVTSAAAPAGLAALLILARLPKEEEAAGLPWFGDRSFDRNRWPARFKAPSRVIAQHRNKLGAKVGLAAQWLV